MSARKEKHIRLSTNLEVEFVKTAKVLGLNQRQAAEIAVREWVQRHHEEVQKRIDEYTDRGGLTINQPQSVTVNVAVFQKADVFQAKDELQRLLDVLKNVKEPKYKREVQLELANALRKFKPICTQTRDPELQELLDQVAKQFG